MVQCLIVDDSEMACEVASRSLMQVGIRATEMLDSENALQFCKNTMPDLIILDVMMPKMDGVAFLEQIRSMKNVKKAYVIACTARDDIETVQSLKQLGINDYVVKPFPPEIFVDKIKRSGLLGDHL